MPRAKRLKEWIANPKRAPSETEAAVIESAPDRTVVLKLMGPRLTVEGLQHAVAAIDLNGHPQGAGVVVDFTDVYELMGGWSIHFAILVHLAKQLHCPVRARGLHDQPLSAAWLYRCDKEIRRLLGLPSVAA